MRYFTFVAACGFIFAAEIYQSWACGVVAVLCLFVTVGDYLANG